MTTVTSSTGLIASVRNPARRKRYSEKKRYIDYRSIVVKAPIAMKPFAGLYNPFPYGCSILCNHPADYESRDMLKKAKESWMHDHRSSGSVINSHRDDINSSRCIFTDEIDMSTIVPEELFRKYTDTDSRPLTPCPTTISSSAITKRCSNTPARRCVTPDPTTIRQKTLLVLDLRRSHSQETILYNRRGTTGGVSSQGLHSTSPSPPPVSSNSKTPTTLRKVSANQSAATKPKTTTEDPKEQLTTKEEDKKLEVKEEDVMKRRGKKKKNKKKTDEVDDGKDIEKEFSGLVEPGETLVSADNGLESGCTTVRHSICDELNYQAAQQNISSTLNIAVQSAKQRVTNTNTFLEYHMIKRLQREINKEVVDNEFNLKRRIALEEALRILEPKILNEDLQKLHATLSQTKCDADSWLTLPRTFTRQSARFELPLDKYELNDMIPMQYLENFVWISSGRKLLYNRVFNRHLIESETRSMRGEMIIPALGEVMGRKLTEEESKEFESLIGWNSDDVLTFKLWCGICALFERIYAKNFCTDFKSKEKDPCNAVENADFETLQKKLLSLNPDERLVKILLSIKSK